MEWNQTVKSIYQSYFEAAEQVMQNAKPGDGLFGMGNAPQKHPCHQEFYDLLQKTVENAVQQGISCTDAAKTVSLMLRCEEWCEEQPDMVRWMLVPAQGLAIPFIPLMDSDSVRSELKHYQKLYPLFSRLPVQKNVISALKQSAKK